MNKLDELSAEQMVRLAIKNGQRRQRQYATSPLGVLLLSGDGPQLRQWIDEAYEWAESNRQALQPIVKARGASA